MRLLIVEDDRKVSRFIRKALQAEGHAVDVAYDGQTALAQAREIDYDLVVLDLMLPELPGLEVLQRVRQDKPNLPVIVLTCPVFCTK